jgi:GMP synthase (glutamine-hydrolysing)
MNILCITHADFETPGIITSWAKDKGYDFTIKKPYKEEQLPEIDSFDMLIIMGGPQSATQLDNAPYLYDEIQLIQYAIEQNKKILGFCLGAQLIGAAFGAAAMKSPEKEIGVYSITLTDEGTRDPLLQELSSSFPVIHWHNDMPGLSDKAVVLATSNGCPRQIIRYQPLIYGFQCHLEIDLAGIEELINACPTDLTASLFTQDKESLLRHNYDCINESMRLLLDKFVQLKI